jgi:hypothetical protein
VPRCFEGSELLLAEGTVITFDFVDLFNVKVLREGISDEILN